MGPSCLIICESPGVGAGGVEASDFGAGWTDLSWYSSLDVLLAYLTLIGGKCLHLAVLNCKSRPASCGRSKGIIAQWYVPSRADLVSWSSAVNHSVTTLARSSSIAKNTDRGRWQRLLLTQQLPSIAIGLFR